MNDFQPAKTLKTFAHFTEGPSVNMLSLIEYPASGAKDYSLSYNDNRITRINDEDHGQLEAKALEIGFVEVPPEIADILYKGDYWGNYSKIKPYCKNEEFLRSVEGTAEAYGHELK